MRINVIGNGFDLYHGLPCKYYHFACYLAETYPDFYEEMSEMFGFLYCIRVGHDDFELVADDKFWHIFEDKLGKLNTTWLEHSLMDDLGLECDDPIDIDIPEIVNSDKIKQMFCEWVVKTLNTKNNFETINQEIKGQKLKLNTEDYFINFNYTQTLEQVYNICDSNVYHIHGKCSFDKKEGNSLVVGHGDDEYISFLSDEIKKLEDERFYLSEQSARNRLNEYTCELTILKDLRKPVKTIIDNLKDHLDRETSNVDEIWVWGLSCGNVDKPYIDFLKDRYPDAKWRFSYYNEEEKNERKQFVSNMQFDETKADYFELSNLYCEKICKQIICSNGIVGIPII